MIELSDADIKQHTVVVILVNATPTVIAVSHPTPLDNSTTLLLTSYSDPLLAVAMSLPAGGIPVQQQKVEN